MYIYYEEFGDVVSVVLSSNGRDSRINFKNPNEAAICNLCTGIFKQVPLKDRDFDDKLKIWTFIGFRGKVIYTQLESMCTQGLFPASQVKKITDLDEKVKTFALHTVTPKEKENKFQAENFFYNPPASVDSSLSPQVLAAKISEFLSTSPEQLKLLTDKELKKYYRAAALKYHPDRNNGDGSKMSELNMLWEIYTNQGG